MSVSLIEGMMELMRNFFCRYSTAAASTNRSAAAFAQDPMALTLAQEAVFLGLDQSLSDTEKGFLYMPYMHSESRLIHEEAVKLFSQPGQEGKLDYELRHKEIIDQFGRYPHRNEILGRQSSAEELVFLQQPGSGF